MSNPLHAFYQQLTDLGVPIFTAPPDGGIDYHRPPGWQNLDVGGNGHRMGAWKPGDAIMAVCGGPLVVIDIDPRNGGDPAKMKQVLDELGVRIFARIRTAGGGFHLYIAGHPDIASTHSSHDKLTIIGFPGVDIQSVASNVFLPGTTRTKWGGNGYQILANNLDALADGGDPEGADAFAGWLATHRPEPTRDKDYVAAPPWTGGQPAGREAAYLNGAAQKSAARLAAVTEGGRNNALNTEAFKLGQFIAGAGLDRQLVVNLLTAACVTNGLMKDGARGVTATINSGLRAGALHPRAVPPFVPPASNSNGHNPPPFTSTGKGGADPPDPPDPPDNQNNNQNNNRNGHAPPPAPTTEDEFWAQRRELAHIRAFSHARLISAWAVLGVVLAQIACTVPPNVVLPPIVGGDASLNQFVAIVGESGSGKSGAIRVARQAIATDGYGFAHLGSGEGIAKAYAHRNIKQNTIVFKERAILFVTGEVDALAALTSRSGATLGPQVRCMFNGEPLGFAYATAEKRVELPEHSYRAGLIVGVQPGRSGTLLDDEDGGTPQRFLWMPAVDPTIPREPVEAPPLFIPKPLYGWSGPQRNDDTDDDDEPRGMPLGPRIVMGICDEARNTIREAAFLRATGTGEPLDGHALLVRLKVGASLAILAGRKWVHEDDWRVAGQIMQRSDQTREELQQKLAVSRSEIRDALAKSEGNRDAVREQTKYLRDVVRVREHVLHKMTTKPPLPALVWTKHLLRMACRSTDRQIFDDIWSTLPISATVH